MILALVSSMLVAFPPSPPQHTVAATGADLKKFTYSVMKGAAQGYTDTELTQWAMVYVYNNSGQTLINPKFKGFLKVGGRSFDGKQTQIKFGSAIPGSFYEVLPPGVVTSALITFTFPIESYVYGRQMSVQLVAADKMKPGAPLTEPNVLRQFLYSSSGQQITDTFKKQPALAQVRDSVGMPPMGMAILSGKPDKVKALEAAGLKLSGPYPGNITAMHLASESMPDMIHYVKKRQPSWTRDKMNYTPLSYAVYSSKPENVKALNPSKAQLSEKAGALGGTALHDAIAIGEFSVIKMLMSLGADPNALNNRGEPPIVSTFDRNADNMRRVLNLIKPDLSIRLWKPQYTLLQWAVLSNRADAVKVLMERGLSPRQKNAEGKDSFDLLDQVKHPVDRQQMRLLLQGR